MTAKRTPMTIFLHISLVVTSVSVNLILPTALAQSDLSGLTDDELVEQLHRKSYKEALLRRIAERSPEERDALSARMIEPRDRKYPDEYSDEELFEHFRDLGDRNAASRAREELRGRYEGKSTEELSAFHDRLLAEYTATLPTDSNGEEPVDSEVLARRSYQLRLDALTRMTLPEALALNLFQGVYVDNRHKGSLTAFLDSLRDPAFSGPSTRAALEALLARVSRYDAQELEAMGESEYLKAMIEKRLHEWQRQQLDMSFAAVRSRDWGKNRSDVLAMGRFEEPEALDMLLQFYDGLPKEPSNSRNRLFVLGALLARPERTSNGEVQRRLRDDLPEILGQDYNHRLLRLTDVVSFVEKTNDPYFIPLLRRRLADMDWAEIRRDSTLGELVEVNIRTVQDTFERVINGLEAKAIR